MLFTSLFFLTTRTLLIASVATCCFSVAAYAQINAQTVIALTPASESVTPGEKKQILATLVQQPGNVPTAGVDNTKFAWKLADQGHAAFVQISSTHNQLTVVGLSSPAGMARPSSVPVIVTYKDTVIPVDLSAVLNVGLTSPRVTATWDVLPSSVCKHSFGRSVGSDYYCIEVTIANHSGFDLQIADVSFTLPAAAGVPRLTVSSTGYNTVRNTLRHRNMFYPRAIILNTITALGPVLTGFTPYFHNQAHRGNFTEGINILSNPLEKGLEKAWPDPTGRHLDNYDGITLREGVIIPNNGPPLKTRVFYPKKNLGLPRSDREDPAKVRRALGDLTLSGSSVQYVNSIRVTSP